MGKNHASQYANFGSLQENIYLETFLFPKLIIYFAKLIYLKVFFCYML